MSTGRYVRRPAVVEAFRLGHQPMPAWFLGNVEALESVRFREPEGGGMPVAESAQIYTRNGPHTVRRGEWVLRATGGAWSSCSDFNFMAAYQAAPAPVGVDREDAAMGGVMTTRVHGAHTAIAGLKQRETKRCMACGHTKPRTTEHFHVGTQKGTGYRAFSPRCRDCSPEPTARHTQPAPGERKFEIELVRLEAEVGPYATWQREHHEMLTERMYRVLRWTYEKGPGEMPSVSDPGSPFFHAWMMAR